MTLVAHGWDASWDPPDQQCMKNAGYAFLVRYGSRDPSKNLTKAELDSALRLGLHVCVVWQEGKTQMLRGYSGGQTDARDADSFVKGLGLAGIPVYFSADWDVQDYEQDEVHAYLDGAASVIGRGRTGIYGGFNAVSKALNAGKAAWAWQCYAWSGSPTKWDGRAQLRQTKIDYARCGGTIDDDEAWAADYGQWPRTGEDMTPSVAYWHNPATDASELHQAMRWSDGRVCYAPPGGGFSAVDENSNSRSGVDIAVSRQGAITIAYVNQGGEICHYRRASGGGAWTWHKIGGSA